MGRTLPRKLRKQTSTNSLPRDWNPEPQYPESVRLIMLCQMSLPDGFSFFNNLQDVYKYGDSVG